MKRSLAVLAAGFFAAGLSSANAQTKSECVKCSLYCSNQYGPGGGDCNGICNGKPYVEHEIGGAWIYLSRAAACNPTRK